MRPGERRALSQELGLQLVQGSVDDADRGSRVHRRAATSPSRIDAG